MRTFTCAAIMLAAVALSAPFAGTAFAQAGSTGGTLGQTDKSVSGQRNTEPEQPPTRASRGAHRPTAEKSPAISCQKVLGTWDWFVGPSVTFKEDGTGGNGIFTFTWTCSSGNYVLTWSHGYTDRIKLSADGKNLDGKNQNGTHIFASRQ
jgi:hypothetical protein